MGEILTRVKGSVIANAIASIILGVLFLAQPVLSGVTLCYFIGAILVVAGITKAVFSFVSPYGLAESVLGAVIFFLIGILCFTRPDIIGQFLTILAGFYIVADAGILMSGGLVNVKSGFAGGWVIVISSLILMICGLCVMFAPVSFIMELAGAFLIIDGIFYLVLVAFFNKKDKENREFFNAE